MILYLITIPLYISGDFVRHLISTSQDSDRLKCAIEAWLGHTLAVVPKIFSNDSFPTTLIDDKSYIKDTLYINLETSLPGFK